MQVRKENKASEKQLEKLVGFFFEVGTLRKLARAHRVALLTDDLSDNIASHSFRVAIMAYFIAALEGEDPYRCATMALLHDLEESRSGDINYIQKKFVKVFIDEIREAQFSGLPNSKETMELSEEYENRKSRAAMIAKDADILDQLLLLREYEWAGNSEAKRWLSRTNRLNRVHTKTAKKLGEVILKQRPSEWWDESWTADRR